LNWPSSCADAKSLALLLGATSAIGCSRGYTKRDATADEQRAVCALPSVDSAAWQRGVPLRAAPMTALLPPETRVVNEGFNLNKTLAWIGKESPTDTTSAHVYASIDPNDDGWLYIPDHPSDIPILTPGSQRTHFAECDVTIDGRPAKVATYLENSGVTYGTYAAALRLSLGPGVWLRATGTAPSPVARAHMLREMRSLRFDAGATGGAPDPLAPVCDAAKADTTGWTRTRSPRAANVTFLQPANHPVASEILASPGWNLRPNGLGPTFWCEGRDGDRVYGLIVHHTVNPGATKPISLWFADGYVRFGPAAVWHAHVYLGMADTGPLDDQRLRTELLTVLRSAIIQREN
jgi:hypothetical protein